MHKYKKIYLFLAAVFVLFIIGRIVWAACGDTEQNVRGWGWNPYIGWISLSCANCDQDGNSFLDIICGGDNSTTPTVGYGVDVSGTNVTGYAWNGWGSNPGEGYWICFGETCGGNDPDGNSMEANLVGYDGSSGQITGWAKFIGWGDDGWIKLSGSNWETTFSGNQEQGTFNGWAWNSKIGWIEWMPTEIITCNNIGENDWFVSGQPDCDQCDYNNDNDGNQPGDWSPYLGMADQCDSNCGVVSVTVQLTNYEHGIEVNCTDGIDNDCDGHFDCDAIWYDDDCLPCTTMPPDTPTGLIVTSDSCGVIDVSWDEVTVEDGTISYNVYKALNIGDCSDLGGENCYQVATGVTYKDPETGKITYLDTAVIPRINYYYWVTSVKSIDVEGVPTPLESAPSNYSSARTVCFPGSEWEER